MTKLPIARVPKLWPGETVVCIGGGPSLKVSDVDYCRGKARVIAVNDAYRLAPWADVLYACDWNWWKGHQGAPGFTGLKYALAHPRNPCTDLHFLEDTGREGLEDKPTGLRTGSNSGYQAMNLALHFGATRILLLGYDMQKIGGKDHWFGAHPPEVSRGTPPYMLFLKYFTQAAPLFAKRGITVINCSPKSALHCFPRQSLREALPEAQQELAS